MAKDILEVFWPPIECCGAGVSIGLRASFFFKRLSHLYAKNNSTAHE